MDLIQHVQHKKRNPWIIIVAALVVLASAVWLKQKLNQMLPSAERKIHLKFEFNSLPDSIFPMVFIADNVLLFSVNKQLMDTSLIYSGVTKQSILQLIDQTNTLQFTDTINFTQNTAENYHIIFRSFQ